MTVFFNNLKRIFRRKANLLIYIFIPIILTSVILSSNYGSESPLRISIIDNDKTALTGIITDNLKSKYDVVQIKENEIQRKLIDGTVEFVLVIDKGFTDNIINGNNASVKSYSIKETNETEPLKLYINNLVSSSKNISKASGGDKEKFYKGLAEYRNGSFTAEYRKFSEGKSKKNLTLNSLGFLIMAMMFMTSFTSTIMLEDKSSRTFYRMLSSPMTAAGYMLQNILSFLVISIIQICIMFLCVKVIFKGDFGPSVISMFVIFFVFSIVCVSLGTAITSISRDTKQASAISTLINIPVTMLGGCYWPRDIMPDLLKKISDFVPTTWALNGAQKVINSGNIASASAEIGIMLLFALVFFLLSSYRKNDIAK